MKFWIYLKKELTDLIPHFENAFGVNNLYHDSENVYEWIESKDKNSRFYLNISRTHDWEKGDYDQPMMITVKSNNYTALDEEEIANRIKSALKCKVYVGELSLDENDKAITIPRRIY